MQRRSFEETVQIAVERDPRYEFDAYLFLRESLDHTLKIGRKGKASDQPRHVRGPELLAGFRDLALEQFGPLALTVLETWGVRSTEDVGEMVFNLIEVGAFGRTAQDSKDDFKACFDFREAFTKPFQPRGARPPVTPAGRRIARRKR